MFEDIEFDPMAAGLGLLGGILSVIVMSKVEVGLIFKLGAFLATSIVCYFMVGKIFNR